MNKIIKMLTVVAIMLALGISNILSGNAVSLSSTEVTLNVGDVTTVTVFEDVDGYWISDKPDVAAVENGVIRGLSAGDAIVSFVEQGDIKNEVKVSVVDTKAIKQFNSYNIKNTPVKEDDLKPGRYVVKAERGKFGTYTIKLIDANIGYMQSGSVLTNTVVDLKENYNIELSGCLLYSLESIKLNTSSQGSFIVGQHIPAGTYIIETDNCDVGQYILYKDASKSEIVESYNIKQDTPYSVRLYEGEYIELNGLKLVG